MASLECRKDVPTRSLQQLLLSSPGFSPSETQTHRDKNANARLASANSEATSSYNCTLYMQGCQKRAGIDLGIHAACTHKWQNGKRCANVKVCKWQRSPIL